MTAPYIAHDARQVIDGGLALWGDVLLDSLNDIHVRCCLLDNHHTSPHALHSGKVGVNKSVDHVVMVGRRE